MSNVPPSTNPPSAIRDSQFADPRALPALYRLASLTTSTDDPESALRAMLDGSVEAMCQHLDDHPTVGAVGGTLLNPDGTFQGSYAEDSK